MNTNIYICLWCRFFCLFFSALVQLVSGGRTVVLTFICASPVVVHVCVCVAPSTGFGRWISDWDPTAQMGGHSPSFMFKKSYNLQLSLLKTCGESQSQPRERAGPWILTKVGLCCFTVNSQTYCIQRIADDSSVKIYFCIGADHVAIGQYVAVTFPL